jgi:hypothetical protein
MIVCQRVEGQGLGLWRHACDRIVRALRVNALVSARKYKWRDTLEGELEACRFVPERNVYSVRETFTLQIHCWLTGDGRRVERLRVC